MANDFNEILAQVIDKRKKSEQKVYDYYDVDKAAAEVEAAKSPIDLLKLIDKLNKPFNAVTGGLYSAVKQKDRFDEVDFKKVWKSVKTGWDQTDKKTPLDILKIKMPDEIKAFEKEHPWVAFGLDLGLSLPLDPLTWMPVGTLNRLGKASFGALAKGAKFSAEGVLGADKVANIINKSSDLWLKTGAEWFNKAAIWKNNKVTDIVDSFLKRREGAAGVAEAATLDALKMDRQGFLRTVRSFVGKEDAVKLGKLFSETADKDAAALGLTYIKEVEAGLKDLFPKAREGLPLEAAIKITEGGPVTKFAKELVAQETRATKLQHTLRYKGARDLWKRSSRLVRGEIDDIQKALKQNVNVTNDYLRGQVDRSIGVVNDVKREILASARGQRDITSGALTQTLQNLKDHVNQLGKYQKATYKVGKKRGRSVEAYKALSSRMRDVEIAVAKSQISTITGEGARALGELNDLMSKVQHQIKAFGNIQATELRTLRGAVALSKEAQLEFVGNFKTRLKELLKKQADLNLRHSGERDLFQASLRETPKYAAKLKGQYVDTMKEFVRAGFYQKVIAKHAEKSTEIFEKAISDLPEGLQVAARKARVLFEGYKTKMAEAGVIKHGLPTLYFPRRLTKDTMEEVFGKGIRGYAGAGGGAAYKRKIATAAEHAAWATKHGGEVEYDIGHVLLDYVKSAEMMLAKKTLQNETFTRFGVRDMGGLRRAAPQLSRNLEYLFNNGLIKTDNTVLSAAFKAYGTTLNWTKMMLTIMNPAFHVRNVMGFPFLAATTAGELHGLNPLNYSSALGIMSGTKGKVAGHSFDAIREALSKESYFASSWTRGDIKKSAAMLLNRYKGYDPRRWIAEAFKVSSTIEDFGRTGAMVANLRAGKTIEQAMIDGKRAMFDFNMINSPADKALQGIFGFYVWTRRNLPMQLATVFKDPKQYAQIARVLDKVAVREKVTQEEIDAVNDFDKQTLKVFGDVIDGVREYYSLGFHPMEQAYQTYNTVVGKDWRQALGANLNPLLGTLLDFYYSKDSFAGKGDFGYSLPAKYTQVIPEKAAKALGLTVRERPKWRAGEQVGTEKVLYGDPDTIAMIRKIPLVSRQMGDIAGFLQSIADKKAGSGALKYVSGIRRGEADIEGAAFRKQRKVDKIMKETAMKRGAAKFENVYIPKSDKEDAINKRLGIR